MRHGNTPIGTANPHARNAGNLGDILKHAALLALADCVARGAAVESVRYLETHAFQLTTPMRDPASWQREIRGLVAARPTYGAYASAESRTMARGLYRCSVGLSLDRLRAPRVFLAEKNPDTRRQLAAQLAAERILPDALVREYEAFLSHRFRVPPGPFLALVDPFSHPERAWPSLLAGAEALHAEGAPGAVLAFHYGREQDRTWPESPRGFGPSAFVLHRPPYHLAAWVTPDLVPSVRGHLAPLGWGRRTEAPTP